jgi:hypothetical protein
VVIGEGHKRKQILTKSATLINCKNLKGKNCKRGIVTQLYFGKSENNAFWPSQRHEVDATKSLLARANLANNSVMASLVETLS